MSRRPAAGAVLGLAFDQLVRLGLRGVWVRGTLPSVSAVWAANHHSWWDGFIASAVLSGAGVPASMVVDADYRYLGDAGVVGADRPRAALTALRSGRVLVVLPEGQLRPPGPLGPLAPGAAWLARTAPAPLVPAAVRVVARGHQHPEALVDLGVPVEPPDTGALAVALGAGLARLDSAVATEDPRIPPAGFRELVPGRRSWDERITRLVRR